jgi:cephalosporin-C deacetylase-like acetyl esterase
MVSSRNTVLARPKGPPETVLMETAERRNVEFAVEGGVTLRGWLFVPDTKGPAPAITMAHGYAGVKEHGLERFALAFAAAGFIVLIHDHRNFGGSDGAERVAAYERALEPKKLQLVSGGHFAPYVSQFDKASEAAIAWFREHQNASGDAHND